MQFLGGLVDGEPTSRNIETVKTEAELLALSQASKRDCTQVAYCRSLLLSWRTTAYNYTAITFK
jgi:hypothetical protein